MWAKLKKTSLDHVRSQHSQEEQEGGKANKEEEEEVNDVANNNGAGQNEEEEEEEARDGEERDSINTYTFDDPLLKFTDTVQCRLISPLPKSKGSITRGAQAGQNCRGRSHRWQGSCPEENQSKIVWVF